MHCRSFGFALLGLSYLSPVAAQGLLVSDSESGGRVIESADDWVVLNGTQLIIQYPTDKKVYGCVVTASADVRNPGPALRENQYRFVLAHNTDLAAVDGPGERTLELVDNPIIGSGFPQTFIDVDDPDSESVTVTSFFGGLDATNGYSHSLTWHSFYFLARKVQAGDTNATVLDSSMSMVCKPSPVKKAGRE